MKRMIAISLALFGLLVIGGNALPYTNAAMGVESAVVEFPETVKLRGVLLRGEYLVVHDEIKMAQGLPCTYVYRGKDRTDQNLVTAFHCVHADRAEVSNFTVTYARRLAPYAVPEIAELQFAGSTAGHIVP